MLAQTILIAAMLVTLLTGLFFNYRQATELKNDLGSMRLELKADIARLDAKLDARTDAIQSDLRQFYHMTGKIEGRLEAVERRQA